MRSRAGVRNQSRGCRSYRLRRTAIVAASAGCIVAGCSSAGPHPAAEALTAGCSTSVSAGALLAAQKSVTLRVPGHPFAVVGTADGRWAFASVSNGGRGEIAVLALDHHALRLVRTVSLPGPLTTAFGLAMTHDGRLLLVAGYTATAVLSVPALEDGGRDPVLGLLADAGAGQTEIAVSDDDRYVFVADESTGGLSVFNLAAALRRGFSASGVAVGIVPLANGAADVAMSPDGGELYVTTYGAYGPHGQLWVIDTARAESGAVGAVMAHVPAGCQPVRVAVSPDGSTVWVTAPQSNALLGFSAASLRDDPSRALRAVVRVGSEPVGLLLVDDGRLALVGNSNRGLVPGTASDVPQTVSVVDTAAALARRPAVIGAVPAGLFPRDLSLDRATGEILLANFTSGTVEEFPVPTAP
jgi:DNA-binding beta-propeller fold protein YncE